MLNINNNSGWLVDMNFNDELNSLIFKVHSVIF